MNFFEWTMNVAISAVVVLVLVMGAPSVYVVESYQSGYKYGCNDADKDVKDRYINSIGHSESHHTDEFMNEYHQGFKACSTPGDLFSQDISNFGEPDPGQQDLYATF